MPGITHIKGHVCISLDDQISHVMGHGVEMQWYNPKGNYTDLGLNTTRAMKRMYDRIKIQPSIKSYTRVGYILLWSDAYLARKLRNADKSIWLLTATLSPPKTSRVSKFHTYIMSIGSKDGLHREVLEYYLWQRMEMRKGKWRYCGKTKKMDSHCL